MKTVILQKPGPYTSKGFKQNLESALPELRGDLKASLKLEGYSKRGWAIVNIEGEDSEILEELLNRKFLRAHGTLADIKQDTVCEGIIQGCARGNLEVDIGIEAPSPVYALLNVSAIRAQLAEGKAVDLSEIMRSYCLISGMRASIRVTRTNSDLIEAWLSDQYIDLLSSWIGTGLDRIQIPDCFQTEVETAIRKSGIERDIVSVEPITLTAMSVTCKLGTDAVGLLAKLGKLLWGRGLHPFIPRRICERYRPW